MTYLDDTIIRCDAMIATPGSPEEIDQLAREIISSYRNDIPNIGDYRGLSVGGHGLHDVDGVILLRGKLLNLQDKQQKKSQIDLLIEECEEIISSDNIGQSVAEELIERIMSVYEQKIQGLGFRLSYFQHGSDFNYKSDIRMLAANLTAYKEEQQASKEAASTAGNQLIFNPVNQNSNVVSLEISMHQTIERIDTLPAESLSDDEKDLLKGYLASINAAASKGVSEIETPTRKTLNWLAEKGFDVLVAAIPHIAKALGAI